MKVTKLLSRESGCPGTKFEPNTSNKSRKLSLQQPVPCMCLHVSLCLNKGEDITYFTVLMKKEENEIQVRKRK
jgi:hypothetical protein